MTTRLLGAAGPRVSALGLGCMGMSDFYGPADEAESIATIHAALDAGIMLLDTGDYYGMGHNELLIRDALRGRDREQPVLSVKFGLMRDARRQHRRERPAPARRSRTSSPTRFAGSAPTTSTSTGPAASSPTSRSRRRSARSPSSCRPATSATSASPRSAPKRPPRPRRAPDLRPADRVLAALARDRGRDPADLPRARHRHHRLRRPLPRPSLRPLVEGTRRHAGPARLPRLRTTLHGREPRAQPRARRDAARARGDEGRDRRADRDRLGALARR